VVKTFSPEGPSTTPYGKREAFPLPYSPYYIGRGRAGEELTIGDKHFSLSLPMAPRLGDPMRFRIIDHL